MPVMKRAMQINRRISLRIALMSKHSPRFADAKLDFGMASNFGLPDTRLWNP
jgi:hypothetical protein